MFSIGMRNEILMVSLVTPELVAPPLSLPFGQAMQGGEYGSPTTWTVRSAQGPAAATAPAGPGTVACLPAATGAVAAAPGAVGARPATVLPVAAAAVPTSLLCTANTLVSRAMVGTSVTTNRNATARASSGP